MTMVPGCPTKLAAECITAGGATLPCQTPSPRAAADFDQKERELHLVMREPDFGRGVGGRFEFGRYRSSASQAQHRNGEAAIRRIGKECVGGEAGVADQDEAERLWRPLANCPAARQPRSPARDPEAFCSGGTVGWVEANAVHVAIGRT